MTESSDQPGADQEPAPETPKRATRPRRRRTTAKAASEAASSVEPEHAGVRSTKRKSRLHPPAAAGHRSSRHGGGDAAEPPLLDGRIRSIASWILTVLAGIAVAAAVVGFWAHETLLDTGKFMAAVTPAVESEAVKRVVADRLSDQVLEAFDLDTAGGRALDRRR